MTHATAMDERVRPEIVEALVAWRKRNGLTQQTATEVLRRHGLPITLSSLQKWEKRERQPGAFATLALAAFLEKYPTVDPPAVKRRPRS